MTEQEWKNRMTNPKYNELQITTHKDNKPYVFISYKSDSWEQVLTEIVYKLQKEYGLRIYFDKSFNDNNNVWTEQFPTNMSDPNCKAVLAFVDNEYYLSYATLLEIMYSQTYKASVGKKKGLAVIPVNLETIKEPSGDEGKEDTGLGVETFLNGTKNFNARTEKELFDKTFCELKDRKIWKTAQYIYDKEMLSKSVCSIMMGEMFSFIRVSENPYKSGMVEFYDSLVKTIKSVAPDVFDDVADSTLEEINWSEFDKVKSFSYNGEFYNVLDAQNAYISIVDILHQNDSDVNPTNIVDGTLPKYVKFEDGTELNIPKSNYAVFLKDIAKEKIVLYADQCMEGKNVPKYEILSRNSEGCLGYTEKSLKTDEMHIVSEVRGKDLKEISKYPSTKGGRGRVRVSYAWNSVEYNQYLSLRGQDREFEFVEGNAIGIRAFYQFMLWFMVNKEVEIGSLVYGIDKNDIDKNGKNRGLRKWKDVLCVANLDEEIKQLIGAESHPNKYVIDEEGDLCVYVGGNLVSDNKVFAKMFSSLAMTHNISDYILYFGGENKMD